MLAFAAWNAASRCRCRSISRASLSSCTDNSVPDLETLLNRSRGAGAPHPFYVADASARTDMVAFLKELSAK